MALQKQISPADMMLFVEVVRAAGFSAAARHLGLSKQAVSERIAKLETSLGVRLLQRTTRSLRPTAAGARYFDECADIAQRVAQANLAMQAEQATPTGLLRVSAPRVYGRHQLIPVIQIYTERYPDVQVDLRLTDKLVNLVDEGVDVVLRVSHLNDSAISVRPLGQVAAYFVGSPALLNRYAGRLDEEIIRVAPAVSFRRGEIWDMPDGVKVTPNTVLTVNDLEALAAATSRGIGIARVPGILCEPLVSQGLLLKLLGGKAAAALTVYAAYASKKQLAPKIRAFVDVLFEQKALMTSTVDTTQYVPHR